MHRTITTLALLGGAALLLNPTAALAEPQDRTTESFQTVLGSCGENDDLVGDFTVRQASRTYQGREQLHLHLTGTITRTGTDRIGKYAETQLDKFGEDGSETYSGTLSRLVVRGGPVVRASGHAVISADGDFRFTPGTSALVEGDYTALICDALA